MKQIAKQNWFVGVWVKSHSQCNDHSQKFDCHEGHMTKEGQTQGLWRYTHEGLLYKATRGSLWIRTNPDREGAHSMRLVSDNKQWAIIGFTFFIMRSFWTRILHLDICDFWIGGEGYNRSLNRWKDLLLITSLQFERFIKKVLYFVF